MSTPAISDLEREAEESRRRLAATLESLSDNLSPRRMFGEAVRYARAGAASLLRDLARTAAANPVRSALGGLGVVMLLSGKARAQSARAVSRLFGFRKKVAIADKRPRARTIELKARRTAATSQQRLRKATRGGSRKNS